MKIRFLSLCLAMVMLLGMIPGAVFASGSELWTDIRSTDFEGTLSTDWTPWSTDYEIGTTTDKAYSGTQSLQVDNNERARFCPTLTSAEYMKAGWYRLSGYVYLNGATASQLSFQVWRMTADDSNAIGGISFSDSSVRLGETDENGWTYFEYDFQHEATQATLCVVFNNNGGSGKTVYFDDVKYTKYLGEGKPALPAKDLSASLTLNDSFAINFKIAADTIAAPVKVEFYNGETLLKTEDVTGITANSSGKYVFSYTGIAPDKMGLAITAKVYDSDDAVVAEGTASVLELCNAYLNSDIPELAMLAMEVLDYGAAAQKYQDQNATDLVNSHITTEFNDVWTMSSSLIFDYEDDLVIGSAPATVAATWSAVGLYLEDRISIRYTFKADSVDGLTAQVTCGDDSWTISEFLSAGEGAYKFYFDGLNPDQMRDNVTVTIMSGNSAVSPSLTYSIESYVADKFAGTDTALKLLLQEMLYYGDAAKAYVAVAKEAALWSDVISLPVTENTMIGSGGFAQKDANVTVANDTGYTDTYSIKTDTSGRVDFTLTGQSTGTGWHRFSGYVKLTAGATMPYFTMWVNTATSSIGTASPSYTYVSEVDENGWSYFYFYINHVAARTDIWQIRTTAAGGSGVYFDDLKYEKYLGDGEPPVEEEPEWKVMFTHDFEDNTNGGFGFVDGTDDWAVETCTRPGSNYALRLGSRGYYCRVGYGATVSDKTTGYYKLSGYVHMGSNTSDPTTVAQKNIATIWIYGTSTTKGYSYMNAKVGEVDANGWCYFEIIYQRTQDNTYHYYRIGDASLGWPVQFDNIQYSYYIGDGTPTVTG